MRDYAQDLFALICDTKGLQKRFLDLVIKAPTKLRRHIRSAADGIEKTQLVLEFVFRMLPNDQQPTKITLERLVEDFCANAEALSIELEKESFLTEDQEICIADFLQRMIANFVPKISSQYVREQWKLSHRTDDNG